MTEKNNFNETCPIYLVLHPFIIFNITYHQKRKWNYFCWPFIDCFIIAHCCPLFYVVKSIYISFKVMMLFHYNSDLSAINSKCPCLKLHKFSNIHVFTRSWNDRRARHGGSMLSTKMLVRRQSPRELSQLCIWLCLRVLCTKLKLLRFL